jgi:hypothetical protein
MTSLIKSVSPELVFNNVANSYEFLTTYTSYVSVVGSLVNEFKAAIDYWRSSAEGDRVNTLANFFIDLDQNRFTSFNSEFIYFWVKKYQNAVDDVKQIVMQNTSGNKSFFDEMSDSIGLLANTKYLLDTSVIPFFDINCTKYGPPATYPPSLNNKLSNITKDINSDLSYKTTTLFRTNIIKIQKINEDFSFAVDTTQPHEMNLITDLHHFLIRTAALPQFITALSRHFGKIYSYVNYFSNINNLTAYNARDVYEKNSVNKQFISNITFKENVEGIYETLDILQKKIKSVRSDLTIKQSLAVQPRTSDPQLSTQSIDSKFLNTSL